MVTRAAPSDVVQTDSVVKFYGYDVKRNIVL